MSQRTARRLMAAILTAGTIAGLFCGFGIYQSITTAKAFKHRCSANGWTIIATGRSHAICIDSSGRIVDHR